MIPLHPHAGGIRRRMWLAILTRLALTGLGWGAFHLSQAGARALPAGTAERVIWLLAFSGLLSIPYLAVPPRTWRTAWFQHLQIMVDLLLCSALVYLTGGPRSLFVPFYFAAVLAACFSRSELAGIGYASLGAILLSAVTVAYTSAFSGGRGLPFLDAEQLQAWRGPALYGYLLLQGVSFYIVAFLGGRLAAGLYRIHHLNEVILENLSDGVVAVDEAGRIAFANPEALRLLGLPDGSDWQGADLRTALVPAEAEDLDEVLASGARRVRESRRSPGKGEAAADFDMKIRPLFSARGAVSGALLVLADLTLRRRMEEAQRRAESLKSSAQLAAGIAHEIRNPLASIRGSAQELARSLREATGDDARLLSLIVRETDHVNKIVGGVLDFARPLRLQLAPCDLRSLLEETAGTLRASAAEKAEPHEVDLRVAPDAALVADGMLLRQVFLNLGQNALQAMRGRRGRLRIEASREAGELQGVRVSFDDEGAGIAPEDLPRIFQPFFTTRAQGTGLGLPIALRIVQAHGGEIRVEGRPGGGTRMAVWLPARPVSPASNGARGEAA